MTRRTLILTATAGSVAVVGGVALALAQADPPDTDTAPSTPQQGAACAADLGGALTALPSQPGDPQNRKNLLECSDGSWQTYTAEYPSADRWLSTGPDLVLHGQGVRNAELFAGQWTGTPQTSADVCRAQYVDASNGKMSEPHTVTAEPGRPVEFDASTQLFTVTLSGHCLWQRN